MLIDRPIFIFCQHRTGSTFLKNILNESTSLLMISDEMAISDPLHKGILAYLENDFIKSGKNINKLICRLKEGRFYGRFWRDISGEIPFNFDRLKIEVEKSGRTPKEIISLILKEYRKSNGNDNQRIGVKYFAHFRRLNLIKSWYPDAKIIFLTRDPRAIASSRIKSKGTRERYKKYPYLKLVIKYITLLHSIIEFNWSNLVFNNQKNNSYLKVNYEKLVLQPETTIRKICKYCEIEFTESMLNVSGKYSSHEEHNLNSQSKINNWRNHLGRFDRVLVRILTVKYV